MIFNILKKNNSKQSNLQKIYLEVPYAEKEFAKKLGAKWDYLEKSWFIYNNINNTTFIRWHPSYKIKLKAKYFYLAQTTAECYKCSNPTQVNAIVLPSGFLSLDYDAIENKDQYNLSSDKIPFSIQTCAAILSYVYYISDKALNAIQQYTDLYNIKYSQASNSAYYRSSCLKCFAAHGDNSLIHEFNAPFRPIDSDHFSKITFVKIQKPIELNSSYCTYPNFYNLSLEDVLNIANTQK